MARVGLQGAEERGAEQTASLWGLWWAHGFVVKHAHLQLQGAFSLVPAQRTLDETGLSVNCNLADHKIIREAE